MTSHKQKSKIVVITGASSGIGRAMSETFAAAGHVVIGCARRKERLDELEKRLSKEGLHFHGIAGDVTQPDTASNIAAYALENHDHIDVWINNAGGGVRLADFDQYTDAEVEASLQLNLQATLSGCRAAIPSMKKQGRGHLINVTSICAKRSWNTFSVYTAAKCAVAGFSKSLYLELQPFGIKVSVLTPGQVATEFADHCGMTLSGPTSEMLQPEDVASAALFLTDLPPRANVEEMTLLGMAQTICPM